MEEVAAFGDVPMQIEVELGRPLMTVREILALGAGSVVALKRATGENIDIRVGGVRVGCGPSVAVGCPPPGGGYGSDGSPGPG